MCALLTLAGCVGEDDEGIEEIPSPSNSPHTSARSSLQQSDPRRVAAEASPPKYLPGVQLYAIESTYGDDGELLQVSEHGNLSSADVRNVARPYGNKARRDGYLYHEGESVRSDGTTVVRHYEVRRESGFPSPPPQFDTVISKPLRQALASASSSDLLEVVVALEGFNDWDVDIVPPAHLVSVQDRLNAEQSREAQKAERRSTFRSARDEVVSFLTNRATIMFDRAESGLIQIEIAAGDVPALASLDEVAILDVPHQYRQNLCMGGSGCAFDAGDEWRLGQGRSADRLYLEPFHDSGYTGSQGNPGRHSYGDIVVGVIDHFLPSDQWQDNYRGKLLCGTCGPRIAERYDCDSGGCTWMSNFSSVGGWGTHALRVASIVASDFENGQGDGFGLGDSCWINLFNDLHCAEWERSASGMAPGAKLGLYGAEGNTLGQIPDANIVSALDQAKDDDIDIVANSVSSQDGDCDIASQTVIEAAVENAFDDGILYVNAPANTSTAGSTCNLDSPGDIPKTFTVNALNTTGSSCLGDYTQCDLATFGSVGGMTAPVLSGPTVSQAISGIDLVAPGVVSFTGQADGSMGTVDESSATGTSYAAPHVAGAAGVLKDQFIASGRTWVNSPGRLHTMMLAMGDRGIGSGNHLNEEADRRYGLGRLKMRFLANDPNALPGVWGWAMHANTMTSGSGSVVTKPWSNPLPGNASFLKCVVNEAEDMSNKTTVGDIYLILKVGDPVGGTCSSMSSPVSYYDDSYDLKHHLTVEGAANVGGKCLEYTLVNGQVAGSSIMTNTFCYFSERADDWPN